MNAIIHALACAFRALLFLQMVLTVPPVGFAYLLDALLRLAFRDVTPFHAFFNPVLAWRNLRSFAIAWGVLLIPTFIFAAVGWVTEDEAAHMSLLWKAWGVATLACLAYFWFSRDVGASKQPGSPERGRHGAPSLTAEVLGGYIKARIFGQDANIDRIAALVVDRIFTPRERGPVCTVMLAGPTGTGKTETARLMAEALNLPLFIVRCNEYANRWSIERLIGSQSTYQNSEQGGELVNALRSSVRGVLVLDEIEKADPVVAKVLMTLLDEGTITAAFDGTVINARGWIMFATTNAAHEAVADLMEAELDTVSLRVAIKDALREHWAPEILGRLDRVLAYRRVTDQEHVVRALVQKALDTVLARVPNVEASFTPEAKDYLLLAARRMGKYGYRELERYVEEVTSIGLGGRQHARRRKPLQLEYFVAGGDLQARVVG